MTKLTDGYIAGLFDGAVADPNRFEALTSPNRGEFTIPNSRYLDDPDLRELFGITDRLYRIWDCNGIGLNIHLQMNDGIISNIRIHKFREGSGGEGRPIIRDIVPDQQELRIVKRILKYIRK